MTLTIHIIFWLKGSPLSRNFLVEQKLLKKPLLQYRENEISDITVSQPRIRKGNSCTPSRGIPKYYGVMPGVAVGYLNI